MNQTTSQQRTRSCRAVAPRRPPGRRTATVPAAASISPLRKAAIVLVSLEQSLSSQLLTHLDREAVEAVTWEIARMDRVDPDEQAVVLEEFLGMGLRRLCFVFDDLLRMDDREIRGLSGRRLRSLGARPRRRRRPRAGQGPRRPDRLGLPRRFSDTLKTSGRSGSPTPKSPRPRSANGFAASTTRARSTSPTPAVVKKCSSDDAPMKSAPRSDPGRTPA